MDLSPLHQAAFALGAVSSQVHPCLVAIILLKIHSLVILCYFFFSFFNLMHY